MAPGPTESGTLVVIPPPRKLTHGRVVEYCLDNGPNKGSYRPAFVCRAWSDTCATLKVFVDIFNDGGDAFEWARSSSHLGEGPGTWRWPTLS